MFGKFNRNNYNQNGNEQNFNNQKHGFLNRFSSNGNVKRSSFGSKIIGSAFAIGVLVIGGFMLTSGDKTFLGTAKQKLVGTPANHVAEVNQSVTKAGTALHKMGEKTTPASKEGHYSDEYENNFPKWIADNRFQVLSDFNKFKGPYILFVFSDPDEAKDFQSELEHAMKEKVPVHMIWTHDVKSHGNPIIPFMEQITYYNYHIPKSDSMYGKRDGGVYQSVTLINKNGDAVGTTQKSSDAKIIVNDAIKQYNQAIQSQNNWDAPDLPDGMPWPNYKQAWNDMMKQIKSLKK